MRILIVYDNMYSWGGIQTLLTRFVPRLVERGHSVALLSRHPGRRHDVTSGPLDAIRAVAPVYLIGGDWLGAPRSLARLDLPQFDVILACDLQALLLTAMLGWPRVPVVAGVFAPREYCWPASPLQRRWERLISNRIMRTFPVSNLMFTTDAMARQMGECAGRDFSASPVLPISIDMDRLTVPEPRAVDRRKVVSVARLVPYYCYHLQMVRVIAELRSRGRDLEYHVYGEGEDRPLIEAEARRLGVSDAIVLHGWLDYARFSEAVGDAFAYIGLGTSLVESAACGVPSLVGIDSRPEPRTYGFLQDTIGNDVGGYVPGHREYDITERLEWLASLPPDEYERVGAASRERARDFDVTVLLPRFEGVLAGAEPVRLRVSRADREITRVDRLLALVLWKLGVDTTTHTRHVRPLAAAELRTS